MAHTSKPTDCDRAAVHLAQSIATTAFEQGGTIAADLQPSCAPDAIAPDDSRPGGASPNQTALMLDFQDAAYR
jgi:hypothetical protein